MHIWNFVDRNESKVLLSNLKISLRINRDFTQVRSKMAVMLNSGYLEIYCTIDQYMFQICQEKHCVLEGNEY